MNILKYNKSDPIINHITNDYYKRLQDLCDDPTINEDDRFNYEAAKDGGNFACAYFKDNNDNKMYIAHSGFNNKNKFKS
ncbi:hypothetical protein [Peribacillus frigoritolerans]|uniref:hypothetical protein n=1 Tax=Peribacillus frigoritolerans TaxID=450367 RepID=UPI003F8184B4